MNIEVELRSFITKEKYEELLTFFKSNSKLIKEDYQETFYFDCEEDLRIQKNSFGAKIWMKKGKIHDAHREEIEIKFEKDQFEELEKLFLALNYQVDIKWFRTRFQFEWEDVTVCLDYTKGYGYIIELEKLCDDDQKLNMLELLKIKFSELNIPITPREDFESKFNHYKEHWKELIK
ncbi:CYTH domain-containing protein [Candidatus Woesearchaeota archaeon]|jgi:predicted adenylyl cyclase CyaB|nr:CYTH domain-containing protein [Candidatus Woesearchaeota archaeon]